MRSFAWVNIHMTEILGIMELNGCNEKETIKSWDDLRKGFFRT